MTNSEKEARRTFVVEIDGIINELIVLCDSMGDATKDAAVKLHALRRYVLTKFDQGLERGEQ